MTLENTVREKLSEWRCPAGRQILQVQSDGWSVAVTADQNDVVGLLVWELAVSRDGTSPMDVRTWADGICTRVNGLIEPLKVVEVDVERKMAQLRSTQPLQRGGKSFYYEMMLNGLGAASLRRYQSPESASGRAQTAFAMTHETLAKLVSDIAGV